MSAVTEIAWTDRTWNPVRGCSLVSEGCRSCYAMKQAHRFSGEGKAYHGLTRLGPKGPTWTGEVRTIESALLEPLSWRKPARVFVNSMSDLFHEDVDDVFIDTVFGVMAATPRHTFQILTKRADRMRLYFARLADRADREWGHHNELAQFCVHRAWKNAHLDSDFDQPFTWPLPNVWLGVSVENQPFANSRIPDLLQTPAAVRFISAEPLLGPVDVGPYLSRQAMFSMMPGFTDPLPGLKWVIVGGESGPGARRTDVTWIRSIVRQCAAAQVPCFVKQLGAVVIDRNDAGFDGSPEDAWPQMDPDDIEEDIDGSRDGYQGAPVRVHLKDRKGGDPAEWPDDLRVRQFPEVRAC